MELYKNREWMYYHYWVLMESTTVMAGLAGCSSGTIWYWLHKLGISIRSNGEGVFLANGNYLDMSSRLQEFIEGELLGDGSIQMTGQRSAQYQHGSKYEKYVIWLSGEFAGQGIEQSGKIYKRKTGWGVGYHYYSKSYPELVPIRQCWYPNGKKIVPQDLKPTSIMLRQWYIGDGYLEHPGGNRRSRIILATCAFDKSSIDHLLKELSGLGFKVSHQPSNNTIMISTHSTEAFLNYIGPCPKEIEDIYGYKWDYQDNRKRGKSR